MTVSTRPTLPIAKWSATSAAVVVNESSRHLLVTANLDRVSSADIRLAVHSAKATSIENGHLAATTKDFINKPGGKYPEITIPTGQTQGSTYIEFESNLEKHPDLDYALRLFSESPGLVKIGAGGLRTLMVTIHQDATGEYERVGGISTPTPTPMPTPTPTPPTTTTTALLTVTATPNPVAQGQVSTLNLSGASPNESLTESVTGATTSTSTVVADANGNYTTTIPNNTVKGTYNFMFTGQTSKKSGSVSLVVQ